MSPDPLRVAFVCVQNAGRSQMATAFAEQERRERDLTDEVELITGGTRPADHLHDVVVDAMAEAGYDLSGRTPRAISPEELADTDVVVTMGCSAADVCPATWSGENRDWDLEDPDGQSPEDVRAIREEVRRRVRDFFDEIEQGVPRRV